MLDYEGWTTPRLAPALQNGPVKILTTVLTWRRFVALVMVALCLCLSYIVNEPEVLRLWSAVMQKQLDEDFSSARLDHYEDLLIQELYGDLVLNRKINVRVRDEMWVAHYLQTSKRSFSDVVKPVLLLVHGYGTTSALAWRNVIGRLATQYQVYAVDLPGFGRSTASERFYSTQTGREDALVEICEFMHSFQRGVGIRKPYVVAHSFGGFLMTHCASRNPSLASRLLLADVPGFFSTNGGFDYGWATFFCFGLPHSFMRPMGSYGRLFIDMVLKVVGNEVEEAMISYWHQLQMNPELMSDEITSKFIVHRYGWALGTGVALSPLLNLTMPVLTVTGSLDEISPPHQGAFVNALAGVPHRLIEGAGHVPYILHQGEDFVAAIGHGETVSKLPPQAARLSACLDGQYKKWAEFICLPSPHLSDRAVRRMYKAIQEIRDECEGEYRRRCDGEGGERVGSGGSICSSSGSSSGSSIGSSSGISGSSSDSNSASSGSSSSDSVSSSSRRWMGESVGGSPLLTSILRAFGKQSDDDDNNNDNDNNDKCTRGNTRVCSDSISSGSGSGSINSSSGSGSGSINSSSGSGSGSINRSSCSALPSSTQDGIVRTRMSQLRSLLATWPGDRKIPVGQPNVPDVSY